LRSWVAFRPESGRNGGGRSSAARVRSAGGPEVGARARFAVRSVGVSRGRNPIDEEDSLELDLPPEEARRLGRARHDIAAEEQQRETRRRATGPTRRDHEDARRLAAYGDAPGLVGTPLYAMHVWSRRRTLERELKAAIVGRDRAIEAADASFVELGRRIHARATEVDLGALSTQVGLADHAVMRNEQVQRDTKKRKEARAITQQRVTEAHRRLGEAALDAGFDEVDAEGTRLVRTAVRDANRLVRDVRLRELGIDAYDAAAVRRGWLVLLLALAGIAAAAIVAIQR